MKGYYNLYIIISIQTSFSNPVYSRFEREYYYSAVKAVKNNVETTVKVATKATYQNNVVTPAETVYKASQAASRNLQSNSAALKESGRVGNAFANISAGILKTVEDTAAGFYNFANDPLGTIKESVNYFREDPIRHNAIGSAAGYYRDIAQASSVGDWDTVQYKLGSGLINLAGFAAVGGKTESAVKAKYPNGINLTASGRKVVMADTGAGISVPVSTSVSKALSVLAMGVAGAAGVAKATAAGQVVYSVSGGSDQSGGGGKKESKNSIFDIGKKVLDDFNIDNAYVKPKHLSTTKGKGQKFLGKNKLEAETILKDTLKKGEIISVLDDEITPHGNSKYEILIDAGKEIGTRGETKVKIVLFDDGGMLSAYPYK